MLISDWSSDVCSSDLSACGHWLAAELERAGFAVDQLPISVPWFEGEDCEIALGDARAPLHPQPIVIPTPGGGVTGPLVRVNAHGKAAAPQIGRASCRERVCQYVEISVVAVALKKKQ